MNRGNWLQARREELKLANPKNASAYSLRGVAEAIGVTHAALGHLERTGGMPALELAVRLAKYYQRSPEWVLTGKDATSEYGIPIVGTTLTGPSDDFLKNGFQEGEGQEYVNLPTRPDRRLYALRITDNRETLAYQVGDFIIVDPDQKPITGEQHLVKLPRDDNFIAVLTLITEMIDGYVFNSITELNNRIVMEKKDVTYLHTVVGVVKAWAAKII